ncbi:hypothetical protein [Clostridium beijerinckii]|uniref:Uncharacterized protein n=1 Tax=Clostridium beijerinckii TaxID=1520 RepID=A0AAE5H0U5_CLOBE|nr:hypothetical protein [Clostridium beijerinckii]NSB12109.1 hypothetical protein [Clostridium beijerinckii]OOM27443.1 hypothetical protein CLOBE_30010 [Clostridium beijerinckii]
MLLSYSDLVVFSIFAIGSLLALLFMETTRANKLADEIEIVNMKLLNEMNEKIDYITTNKEDSSNE